jgi:hypothetical protein
MTAGSGSSSAPLQSGGSSSSSTLYCSSRYCPHTCASRTLMSAPALTSAALQSASALPCAARLAASCEQQRRKLRQMSQHPYSPIQTHSRPQHTIPTHVPQLAQGRKRTLARLQVRALGTEAVPGASISAIGHVARRMWLCNTCAVLVPACAVLCCAGNGNVEGGPGEQQACMHAWQL